MGTEGGRFLFVRPTGIRYEHTLVSGFGPIYCKCGGQQSVTSVILAERLAPITEGLRSDAGGIVLRLL